MVYLCMDTSTTSALGNTPNEAYQKYLDDNGSCQCAAPEDLRWFQAIEVKVALSVLITPKAPVRKVGKSLPGRK